MGVLAVALLAWFLVPYALGGFGFPLGPDAPVYLWWIRLAGVEGLSAVGHRPGVPALALALEGALHLSEVQVVAALEGALGVAVGLASASLLRASGARRATWLLGGWLAGTFAVHLSAGYLANLAFAVAFLAAAAVLADAGPRAAVAAAVLLGAGGLAHPLFFVLGAVVLLLAAAFAWRADRDEALRVGAAALGGGAIVGFGLLTLLGGPRPPELDTSKDGFLRRAGLADELRQAYLERFLHRWARYVPWLSVPLAIAGLRDARGFLGRFLRGWGLVTLGGITVALATGLAPADRFITFGFVVALLAALGTVRVWDALSIRPVLASATTGALVLVMSAGAWIAWDRQEPFISPLEVERVTDAHPWIAFPEPDTPVVVSVNDDDPSITFLATRAANVIRAAVPPDRIRDVVVVVPAAEGDEVTPTRAALTRVSIADAGAAVARAEGRRLDLLLAPFDRVDAAEADAPDSPWRRVSTGVFVSEAAVNEIADGPDDPLEPSSPAGIAWATITALALLGLAGYGWARSALRDRAGSVALAPAFGVGAITLAAIVLERLGAPLDGAAPGGVAASAVAGACGYLAWFVLERRARAGPSPQVDEQPHE